MTFSIKSYALLIKTSCKKPPEIIAQCKDHKPKQQGDSDDLCYLHDFLRSRFPCHHFIKQEYDVPTIECRNRKKIHERQDER